MEFLKIITSSINIYSKKSIFEKKTNKTFLNEINKFSFDKIFLYFLCVLFLYYILYTILNISVGLKLFSNNLFKEFISGFIIGSSFYITIYLIIGFSIFLFKGKNSFLNNFKILLLLSIIPNLILQISSSILNLLIFLIPKLNIEFSIIYLFTTLFIFIINLFVLIKYLSILNKFSKIKTFFILLSPLFLIIFLFMISYL